MVVILDLVANTFVVVRLFETAKFVKGCVMFEAFSEDRPAPEAIKLPVTVSASIFAPSATVNAYPGLEAVWTATFP